MNIVVLKNITKWLWGGAVLGFVLFYIISKRALIVKTYSLLPYDTLLISALLIMSGKLCLVTTMSEAVRRFEMPLRWRDCFYIYNLTQLAKYIPGSIWQFVGRFSILHERGIVKHKIRDSMLAEHIWIISSASMLAGILSFKGVQGFIKTRLPAYSSGLMDDLGLVVLFLLASIAVIFIVLRSRWVICWVKRITPPLRVIPILVLTWVLLGSSLWVTLQPFVDIGPSVFYIIGVYCFAYVIGFFVPFAPAGIGVREGVLTFVLTPFIDADVAIVLAAVNRIIYFAIEILLALFCLRTK